MLQSAHVLKLFSVQHFLIAHQVFFADSLQPGHLPLRNDPQEPQYRPQNAIISGFAVMTFCELLFMTVF
jgi:hypothetical protein